jgi:Holliday junction resolvasome RuvABC ATP-dependent DNA helicase subunit
MKNNDQFPDIVGQDRAKKRLQFYLQGYEANYTMPHLMFIAPKGCGKTTLAKAMGKAMFSREDAARPKRFLEINCSTVKSVKQFFNQIIIPHINMKECTVLLDECSELPKDVTMMLLTVLNPNSENRTTFSYEDYTVDFDFSRQSFMFATTEAQSVFHALMDRCERVDLEEYTYNQLAEIVSRVLPDYTFQDDVLADVATVLRGNARAAQKISNHIKSFLMYKKSKNFTKKDWAELSDALGILPLGLSPIELQILGYLNRQKESSLTRLSAKTGLTKACVQRDFELYLQKHDLMQITTAGRAITKKGRDYLKDYEAVDSK